MNYCYLDKAGDKLNPVERKAQQRINKKLKRKAFVNGVFVKCR